MDDQAARAQARRGYTVDELSVGMTAAYRHTLTAADVQTFGDLTGDHNPLHFDEAFARTTIFKERIVHGMLSASFLSTALAILPGPGTVYVAQNLSFRAPVRIGDTVEARVTIADIVRDKGRVLLKTVCRVGDTVVVDGDAVVIVPKQK